MNQEHKKLVMFDFDGVLINTLEFSYEIHREKNKDLTWQTWQDYSDGNFHDGIGKAIEEGKHLITDNFPEKYSKNLALMTIEQILNETIVNLSKRYILVIISSSFTSFITDFLKKENILNCFSDILGVDIHRSKILKINSLLEKYTTDPKDSVFITDTLGDIKEANECGVSSIGVTWGLHDRAKLEKGHPVMVIDDPQDLISVIENVLK